MIVRTTLITLASVVIFSGLAAYSQTAAPPSPGAAATSATPTLPAATAGKHSKNVYTGPDTIVVLAPTPMLDGEGKQRVDPDGKLMFNPQVKQLRDKKGHPVFDSNSKPVFQTAGNLGYDEKGKKIPEKKEKQSRMTPVSISAGTLTVDGWTGKARLNYDIADLKFIYVYAPGIGTTIVSPSPFPGAKEQPGAFNNTNLTVTVEGHPIQLSSDKQLLGKKPQSAWVTVDRGFLLPAKFPVFGYGTTTKAPYAWPGSKEAITAKGQIEAPPLPPEVRPTLLLTPCPTGMMRPVGPAVLPGKRAVVQPCVPIQSTAASPAAQTSGASHASTQ
ncbi:MAG: hypothetical protein M3O31_05745 [Acidobacteriota bacterium]|nr:hypothetical protein [Acidobacteriota bacterium]